MLALSKELVSRCRRILLECDKFDSAETLKTVFSVGELAPFQSALPEAHSREDRVDKLIAFLMRKKIEKEHSLFLPFLETLRIYIPSEDNLYKELEQLCIDIGCLYFSKKILTNHNHTKYSSASSGDGDDFSENLVEIASYFLKLNYMREKHLIEDVVRLLPLEIAQDISLHGPLFGFANILHIVQICFRHPDGLEKLAYALYQKEKDSPDWQALDASLRKISKKTVTYTRLQQLQLILARITWPEKLLSKAYKVSMPIGWMGLNAHESTDSFPSMLENLASAPLQSDGTFPILVFAQYLASYAIQHQETSIQIDLTKWITERTQELRLSSAQVSTLHDKVSAYCSPSAYYLLIMLDPEDESNFCIQAWLVDSEDNVISNAGIEVEDASVSLEQIPVILDLLLEKCGDYLAGEIDKLIIEFILPHTLLCYPVDHWLVDTGMEPIKLGIQHKVVVRSLERLQEKQKRGKHMRALWASKWNELQKMQVGSSVSTDHRGPVWICNEDQCGTHESLYAALRSSPIVCLALTFAPLDHLANPSYVLKAAIGAGIPIALWSRKHSDNLVAASDLFKSFLSPETLLKMPALVWKQRLAAAESGDEYHQGHHLTLLWDDPNRLPPTANALPFAMPSARKGA